MAARIARAVLMPAVSAVSDTDNTFSFASPPGVHAAIRNCRETGRTGVPAKGRWSLSSTAQDLRQFPATDRGLLGGLFARLVAGQAGGVGLAGTRMTRPTRGSSLWPSLLASRKICGLTL